MKQPILYLVVPCYNEEKVLPISGDLFLQNLSKLVQSGIVHADSRILYVNDGSRDNTWPLIQQMAKTHAEVEGISLSHNQGHQNALLAGMMTAMARCDIAITLDCDGQDDIAALPRFIQAYQDGAEVVYGVRANRKSDSFFKRFSAEGFYKLLRAMGADIVYNHADYRLLSRRALRALSEFKEANLFLRGIVPLIGFKTATCEYDRAARIAGETKYPLSKMLMLALDGITSFSVKPLRLITALGLFISLGSFLAILWVLIVKLFGFTITGWTSMICAIFFMGGVQLLCLGVIGEYIGKMYQEVKARPRYLIAEATFEKEGSLREEP